MMQMPTDTPTPSVPSCCWLDDDGPCPTPCVFDDPQETIGNCSYAVMLQGAHKPKTACKHYRAALDAEQQGPTDEEIGELIWQHTTSTGHGERLNEMAFARALLARYGGQP